MSDSPEHPSHSTTEAGEGLSRRERLMGLIWYNRELFQWHAETYLAGKGPAWSMAVLLAIKAITGGQIKRPNLWQLPQWWLSTMSNEEFDQARDWILLWLRDL